MRWPTADADPPVRHRLGVRRPCHRRSPADAAALPRSSDRRGTFYGGRRSIVAAEANAPPVGGLLFSYRSIRREAERPYRARRSAQCRRYPRNSGPVGAGPAAFLRRWSPVVEITGMTRLRPSMSRLAVDATSVGGPNSVSCQVTHAGVEVPVGHGALNA